MNQPRHPSTERISDLLAGALPATEAMDVNAHLASCSACRRAREDLLDLTAMLAEEGAAPVEMPPDVVAAVEAAVGRASLKRAGGYPTVEPVRPSAGRQPWKWLAGAAAAVVVAGVGVAGVQAISHGGNSGNATSADSAGASNRSVAQQGGAYNAHPPKAVGGRSSSSALPDGKVPAEALESLAPAGVPGEARRLAARGAALPLALAAGCATPIDAGPSTVVRFEGRRAVLTVDLQTRLATIYDCATAKQTLYVTGY